MILTQADALRIPLPDKSVQTIVTSPPYWGLRDYGLATWEGGDPECDHRQGPLASPKSTLQGYTGETVKLATGTMPYRDICAKCGAIRHDAGIGLEPTPEQYIANMVALGRELWRVLRDDGTLWMNLGDSYASSPAGHKNRNMNERFSPNHQTPVTFGGNKRNTVVGSLKPKDLCGIPWRVALAYQADGWYLRSDIIWHKPNPMPESVTDRPTKAHEYIFLLTKRPRYFYDADAVREENTTSQGSADNPQAKLLKRPDKVAFYSERYYNPSGRNRRTVWTIATQPYSGAHFATFPEALVEPCVKAGTSERGCCPECGKPWERVVEKLKPPYKDTRTPGAHTATGDGKISGARLQEWLNANPPQTLGFRPTCDHDHDPIPCTVLDPFAGSGTTGVVARRLGRRFVGLDLSAEYLQLARKRLGLDALDAWNTGAGKVTDDGIDALPLFALTGPEDDV